VSVRASVRAFVSVCVCSCVLTFVCARACVCVCVRACVCVRVCVCVCVCVCCIRTCTWIHSVLLLFPLIGCVDLQTEKDDRLHLSTDGAVTWGGVYTRGEFADRPIAVRVPALCVLYVCVCSVCACPCVCVRGCGLSPGLRVSLSLCVSAVCVCCFLCALRYACLGIYVMRQHFRPFRGPRGDGVYMNVMHEGDEGAFVCVCVCACVARALLSLFSLTQQQPLRTARSCRVTFRVATFEGFSRWLLTRGAIQVCDM